MYSIGAVCKLTGLNSSTIRTWERRYGLPSVQRAGNGRRLYTEEQVQYLKSVAALVAQGHAISDLAEMQPDRLNATALNEKRGVLQERSPYLEGLLAHLHSNDLVAFRRLLGDALAFLAPSEVVGQVISPLLRDVGALWEAGKISIFQEHLATAVIRQLILTAAGAWRGDQSSRRILFTTLEGEMHEVGILCAWYIAKAANFDAIYLGPNLPSAEIEMAARVFKADLVVISFTACETAEAHVAAVRDLNGILKNASLWIGAPPIHTVHAALSDEDTRTFSCFAAFERSLFSSHAA